MLEMQVGHFEPDGALIYLPIGFVPDLFFMAEYGAAAAAVKMYYWWSAMEDEEATYMEGLCVAEGVTSKLATTLGILAYDTGSQGPTIAAWAISTAYTARSATARGSLVRRSASTDTDKNGLIVDANAIFECVTAGTSGTSVPTWPAAPGDQSASDNGVIWEKAEDIPTYRMGYKGVRISATPQTDGQEMYYAAWNCGGNSVDWGDVVGWASGIYDPTI